MNDELSERRKQAYKWADAFLDYAWHSPLCGYDGPRKTCTCGRDKLIVEAQQELQAMPQPDDATWADETP